MAVAAAVPYDFLIWFSFGLAAVDIAAMMAGVICIVWKNGVAVATAAVDLVCSV